MSGYLGRDEAPPAPLSWTQRIGVACMFVGAAIVFAYIGGSLGLVPKLLDSPAPGTAFVAIAAPLVAMRSGPLSPGAKRQRIVIVAIAIAACAAGFAVAFFFKGAH